MTPIDQLIQSTTYAQADTLFKNHPKLGVEIVDLVNTSSYKATLLLNSLSVLYRCLQDNDCKKSLITLIMTKTPLWSVASNPLTNNQNTAFTHVMNRIKKMEWDAIQHKKPSVLKLALMFADVMDVRKNNILNEMLFSANESKIKASEQERIWWHSTEKSSRLQEINILQESYTIGKNPLHVWKLHVEYMTRLAESGVEISKDMYTTTLNIFSPIYGRDTKQNIPLVEALYWSQLQQRTTLLSEKEMVLATYMLTKSINAIHPKRLTEMVQTLGVENTWEFYKHETEAWEKHKELNDTILDEKSKYPSSWQQIIHSTMMFRDFDFSNPHRSVDKAIDINGMLDI